MGLKVSTIITKKNIYLFTLGTMNFVMSFPVSAFLESTKLPKGRVETTFNLYSLATYVRVGGGRKEKRKRLGLSIDSPCPLVSADAWSHLYKREIKVHGWMECQVDENSNFYVFSNHWKDLYSTFAIIVPPVLISIPPWTW